MMAVLAVLLAVQLAGAGTGAAVSVSSDGWTITADKERAALKISRENLGTVLEEIRLNLRGHPRHRRSASVH
jgi:hypothetical protein